MTSVARILFSVLGEVRRVIEKDLERKGSLYTGLISIRNEMELVGALIKQDEEHDDPVQGMRIRKFQELAYDVEDFVEVLWEPGRYGHVLVAIGADPRLPHLEMIEYFKNTLAGLKDNKLNDLKPSAKSSQDSDSDHGDGPSMDMDCEVIDGPKKKIEELLLSSAAELSVISIVGCRGVGKTALARALFHNHQVRDQFEYVAWFEASGCNDKKALLSKAPENDVKQPGGTTTPANLQEIAAYGRRKEILYLHGGISLRSSIADSVRSLSTKLCTPSTVPKHNPPRLLPSQQLPAQAQATLRAHMDATKHAAVPSATCCPEAAFQRSGSTRHTVQHRASSTGPQARLVLAARELQK